MKIGRCLDDSGEVRNVASVGRDMWQVVSGDPTGDFELGGAQIHPSQWLSPIIPPAIFGIGQNYRRHAEEMGSPIPKHPVVFMKNPASVQHSSHPIRIPKQLKSEKVDFEAELAVVIGKPCLNACLESALDFVLGFTCANDVSARDWQKEWGGGQFCKGKGFDTFCPLGPFLATPDEFDCAKGHRIISRLNGETMQDWTTSDLIFSIHELIVFLSGDTTLLPGTVILTGTPHGVGAARTPPVFLKPGDTIEVEIEGIGVISNPLE